MSSLLQDLTERSTARATQRREDELAAAQRRREDDLAAAQLRRQDELAAAQLRREEAAAQAALEAERREREIELETKKKTADRENALAAERAKVKADAAKAERKKARVARRKEKFAAGRARLLAVGDQALWIGPILAPMAVAWVGQIQFAMTIMGWPLLPAIVFAAAFELTTAYVARLDWLARQDGDSGFVFRAATWIFALIAAAMNYGHAADPGFMPNGEAIAYGVMSLTGIALWELLSYYRHRKHLRGKGLLPAPTPRFGIGRWSNFFLTTWMARRLAIRDGLTTTDAAWAAAVAYWRRRKALKTLQERAKNAKRGKGGKAIEVAETTSEAEAEALADEADQIQASEVEALLADLEQAYEADLEAALAEVRADKEKALELAAQAGDAKIKLPSEGASSQATASADGHTNRLLRRASVDPGEQRGRKRSDNATAKSRPGRGGANRGPIEAARALYRTSVETGKPLTGHELAAQFHMSPSWGGQVVKAERARLRRQAELDAAELEVAA